MTSASVTGAGNDPAQHRNAPAAEGLAAGGSQLERRLVVALSGGMLLLVSWLARAAFGFAENVTQIPAAIGAIVVATPLFAGALREMREGRPGGNALASLAVLAAMANNFFLQAGFLAFFLWLAELVLSRTAWGAQRAIRDLVELTLGTSGEAMGTVEDVTLRVTKLRTSDGDMVTVANGELRQSVNASRDWARVLVTVPLPRDVDLEAITARLNSEGEALANDPAWDPVVLEAPSVAGLDDLGAEVIQVRVVGRSLPAQQWKVARELRRRIAIALRDMDVATNAEPDTQSSGTQSSGALSSDD
jgi:hypothetical protein